MIIDCKYRKVGVGSSEQSAGDIADNDQGKYLFQMRYLEITLTV